MRTDSVFARSVPWALAVGLAALAGALPAWPASGQGLQPVLVELFTSEGCSSCPPADSLLAKLDREQFVAGAQAIVLGEHVTYWNGLGWKDPYSMPEFTERQERYAGQFRLNSPYTPQIVVNGRREIVGSDASALHRAVEDARNEEETHPPVEIRVRDLHFEGNALRGAVSTGPAANARLYAAIAWDAAPAKVGSGENAGRFLAHVAVVRSLVEIRKVDASPASLPFEARLPASGPGGQGLGKIRLIVFLQDARSGAVLGCSETIVDPPKAGA
jgi:hypothetical protein